MLRRRSRALVLGAVLALAGSAWQGVGSASAAVCPDQPPVPPADFTYSPGAPRVGEAVTFTATPR